MGELTSIACAEILYKVVRRSAAITSKREGGPEIFDWERCRGPKQANFYFQFSGFTSHYFLSGFCLCKLSLPFLDAIMQNLSQAAHDALGEQDLRASRKA